MSEKWNAEESEAYGGTVIWSDQRTLPVGELRGFTPTEVRAIALVPDLIDAIKHAISAIYAQPCIDGWSRETINYLESLMEEIEGTESDDEPTGSTETI